MSAGSAPTRAPRNPHFVDWLTTTSTPAVWPPGGPLFHSHTQSFPATAFNPTNAPARFSPITRAPAAPASPGAREIMPAWYGGSTQECAVAESVLHDVPMSGGNVMSDRWRHRTVSIVRPTRPLRLLRLDTDGLRGLNLAPWIVQCGPKRYPWTQQVAQILYDTNPDIDGFVWMSLRRNSDTAVVLYAAGGEDTHRGVNSADLSTDPDPALDFDRPDDWDWLWNYCQPLRITVFT